jgi:hypothetical protein
MDLGDRLYALHSKIGGDGLFGRPFSPMAIVEVRWVWN